MPNRMLSCLALIASVVLIGANGSSSRRSSATSQCIGSDTTSMLLISTVRELITGGKSVSADSLRNRLGLAGIDTTAVTLVTKSSTCASAAAAIDQLAHVSSSGRLVYVIQAGKQRFVLADPNDRARRNFVFDTHFSLIGAFE